MIIDNINMKLHPYNNRHNEYEGLDEEALRKQEEAVMAELNLSPNPYAKIPPYRCLTSLPFASF
jgi:hypothetical protein